jgi:hypothetical protein
MEERLLAGEPRDLLTKALSAMPWKRGSDGMLHCSVTLVPELGGPLLRALMRVEAELLAHDADRLEITGEACRSPEQRRADALVALVLRLTGPPFAPGPT